MWVFARELHRTIKLTEMNTKNKMLHEVSQVQMLLVKDFRSLVFYSRHGRFHSC